MEVIGYGVILRRLTIDKIEMVRNWRNDPKISQYALSQEYITPEMQLKWFNKINNDSNSYSIIEYNNEEIGLTAIKDIDREKKCGETSVYIYEDKYLNSDVPFRVSFCGLDFTFGELNLDYVYGRIVSDNKRAIRYDKAIGADIKISEDGKDTSFILTKENYYTQRDKYVRFLI